MFAYESPKPKELHTHHNPLHSMTLKEQDAFTRVLVPLYGNEAFAHFFANKALIDHLSLEKLTLYFLKKEWRNENAPDVEQLLAYFSGKELTLALVIQDLGGPHRCIGEIKDYSKRNALSFHKTLARLEERALKNNSASGKIDK